MEYFLRDKLGFARSYQADNWWMDNGVAGAAEAAVAAGGAAEVAAEAAAVEVAAAAAGVDAAPWRVGTAVVLARPPAAVHHQRRVSAVLRSWAGRCSLKR